MDVAAWLKNFGLGQYEAAFRDNAIDGDLLPSLTAEDLKDLGVTIVGHRRRLLDAIAALGAASKPAPHPAAASPPATLPAPVVSSRTEPISGAAAEHRPITVMFCDLVGSTALASRLDAEDWRSLVNAYLDQASGAVNRLGGHVLKRLGDGLMALFGYPHAQENDAERAVRAALAIQRALGDMNARSAAKGAPQLSARIGLESGPVVVEATGEVFGEAPNVAARVQGFAEPGAVLVTANVQRQTAGLFVAEDRGAHELKGVPTPVTLYRIVRASSGRRTGGRTLTPLVGREEELGHLRRRWERARNGAGQLTLIVGEPGIGKSRLVEEFRATLGETPHTFVELSSSQLLQNTPLHPIAEWGRQRFGADEPADRRLADLENTLRLVGLDASEYAPLIAPLVDIPLPAERAAKLAPEELRRRQLAALVTWFLAGARSQPVALAFEDLHWADPTSLDLLQALAERGSQAPMLILATARPEFRPPWSLRSHHSVISLSPLDRADVAQMVGELAARHALSKEVVEGLSERTGGVPLFVEEVTRLLIERGEAGGLQAIPPTLQQSLAARLDRLGEAREIAQIGAVLGRDFTYALLRAVGGLADPALESALDRLAGADLLIAEGAGHEASYRFKHALIQDAAYESLLKSRRQALHRRAAEVLRDSAERAAAEPEVIAHHFTEAGLDDQAIEWWGKAGDQALRRSAFQEAIAHLGKAIAMADKAGGTTAKSEARVPVDLARRLDLQRSYAHALGWGKGFAAEETETALARLGEFAGPAEDAAARFAAYDARCMRSVMRGEYRLAREEAETFLREAEAEGRATEAGAARRMLGLALLYQGELKAARSVLGRALAEYIPERDRSSQVLFGRDTEVSAASYLALAEWHLGGIERARDLSDRAVRRAEELRQGLALANALFWKTILENRRDDVAATRLAVDALLASAKEYGIKTYADIGQIYASWARGLLQDPEAGASEFKRALAAYVAQGNRAGLPWFQGQLAELEAATQGPERALKLIDQGLAIAAETGEQFTDPYLHRLRGDILLKCNSADPGPAEDAYQTAIAVAKQQGARSYELLAALALAKLCQTSDRPVEAHAVLAPALEGFSPTPEMPDIAEAQALLAALAETDEVKAAEAQRQRRLHLQTAYGQAMLWSKGFAAEETKVALAHAAELAGKSDGFAERFAACHGQWTICLARGELRSARALASSFLKQAEDAGRVVEAGVARRGLALACYFAGEFLEARTHCERALEACDPEHDRETRERFSEDTGTLAMSLLGMTMWQLGEVERAPELIEQAIGHATELGHSPSMAFPLQWKTVLAVLRGDATAALSAADTVEVLSGEHGMPFWRARAEIYAAWARGRLHGGAAGAADLRRALTAAADQGEMGDAWFHTLLLAELEEETVGADSALARIDEALGLARQVEGRCDLAFPHLLRGELLLRCGPPNRAAAEEAFQCATAIAREQGARSWGLRAGLALAKLYQSTGRPVDAHAVLAPALEGFSPTPEMPEIAEAQALLAALAETGEVRAEAAQRRRMMHLRVAYGHALIATRGYGAPETTEAFTAARESTHGDNAAPERLAADYGLWVGSYVRGELAATRAHAAAFRGDVEARPDSPTAGVAHRVLGATHWSAGEYVEARDHLERALALFEPTRDDDLAFHFGQDAGVAVMFYLAFTLWPLGDVERAASLVDAARARIAGLPHVQTRAYGKSQGAMFELMRGDLSRVARNAAELAAELARLAREHDLPLWRAFGVFLQGLARAESDAPGSGVEDMRRGVDLLREQNVLLFDGMLKIALAEAEARAGDVDRAVAVIDEALATCERTGYRAFEAELHRMRGETLLKRDQANSAPAEEALQTAIAVAKRQGTRSFELRAALTLAKLHQSTGRSADAHAVLVPALEGFSPTPEMPEIAEAQALLAG